MTRFGVVVLVGEPNAGKSSLLNALVGTDLAIVSPKPQSSREPVSGLLTEEATQLVLLDPAGLLEPQYALHDAMLDAARRAVAEANVVLYLVPLTTHPGKPLSDYPQIRVGDRQRVIRVFTKADLVETDRRPRLDGTEFAVSAVTGEGLADLMASVRASVPEGPFRFDPDDVATQPVRFFAAEYVREAAFDLLHDELPYSLHAEVDEFRESDDPVYIRAIVYVERESQKRLVVGRGGQQIKAISTAARTRIETLMGRRVYLDLWVKVLPKWRRKHHLLQRLRLTR